MLAEQENEEKLKDWFFGQLDALQQKIEKLPITENVSNICCFSCFPNRNTQLKVAGMSNRITVVDVSKGAK